MIQKSDDDVIKKAIAFIIKFNPYDEFSRPLKERPNNCVVRMISNYRFKEEMDEIFRIEKGKFNCCEKFTQYLEVLK